MKILLVHNYYKQRGGEDESFEAERSLLQSFGHDVREYTRHNDEIDNLSLLKVAVGTMYNRKSFRDATKILKEFQPDVIHCTNLFPLISTSVYYAANALNIPVVQSLRNYRAMCLDSYFFRSGTICEDCISKTFAWPGIVHKCYKNSRVASTVLAAHNMYHKPFGLGING